jgi:hypothetical protein
VKILRCLLRGQPVLNMGMQRALPSHIGPITVAMSVDNNQLTDFECGIGSYPAEPR